MNNKIQIIIGAFTFIGFGIVVGVILVIIFLQSGFRLEKVTVGPAEFVAPTSQPAMPITQLQLPTVTPQPQGPTTQSLGSLRIFGNSNSGTQIQIPETGIFRFSYRGGAYSTYSIGNSPSDTKTWLTAVLIFRGDTALWDGRRIMDESILLRLADMKYWDSAESAESAAQGQYVEMQLSQDDVLTLIAVDHFDSYGDNAGQVIVEWFLVKY